jgi:hypothetical protein
MKKYRILSPNGFDIEANGGYKTIKEAQQAFLAFQDSYKAQGYYSTIQGSQRLRIPLEDLESYCELVQI